jgi:predicted transposase YbfD/YdcC
MKQTISGSILEHFYILPDPRQLNHRNKKHLLIDCIVITILAVICGADDFETVAGFGEKKEQWLKKFLALPNGIPSHDTFGRVFSILDPEAFQACFLAWVNTMSELTDGSVVAIDGKSVKGSHGKDMKPLHLISAFATANGVTLGQKRVDGKTNEITAIPELLKTLHLAGCIVTIDAIGTQGWIVKKIREKEADYALAVKANQGRLLEDIQKTIDDNANASLLDYCRTSESGHGREEVRECWMTDDLSFVRDKEKWTDLASVAHIVHTRTVNGKTTKEIRHYITSLPKDASKLLHAIREHWKIENSLHWSLDVSFGEDGSRVRAGYAQENLAWVRKFALMLLRQMPSGKGGVKSRRLQAGWDESYLLKLLGLQET